MRDNLGNEIYVGDYVFCYSGNWKHTIQRIKSFRHITGEPLNGVAEAVNFESGYWLDCVNLVSLNALGVDSSSCRERVAMDQSDALGNHLHVGDKVLYLHVKEIYAEVGVIKKITAKSCLLSIKRNRFGQEEYRKKCEELISLSALGIEQIPERNLFRDIVG